MSPTDLDAGQQRSGHRSPYPLFGAKRNRLLIQVAIMWQRWLHVFTKTSWTMITRRRVSRELYRSWGVQLAGGRCSRSSDIAAMTKCIAALDKRVADATEQRKEENFHYQTLEHSGCEKHYCICEEPSEQIPHS